MGFHYLAVVETMVGAESSSPRCRTGWGAREPEANDVVMPVACELTRKAVHDWHSTAWSGVGAAVVEPASVLVTTIDRAR